MTTNQDAAKGNFQEVLDRVFRTTGWRKQEDVAVFLNASAQSVSAAKQRGNFPIEWAFRIAQCFNVTTDWLMTGKNPLSIQDAACACSCSCPLLPPAPINPMDRGNALRFARELANILEKQRNQTARAQSLLERVVRAFDQPSLYGRRPEDGAAV